MFIMLLIGGALLSGVLLEGLNNSSSGDTDEVDDVTVESDYDSVETGDALSQVSLGTSPEIEELTTNTDAVPQDEEIVSSENLQEVDESEILQGGDDQTMDSNNINSSPDNVVCATLDLTEETADLGASPLSDWVGDQSVVKIDTSDCDLISLNLTAEEGSLHIQRADYYERTGSENNDIDIIHTGANIYLVPPGESFPEDYNWSESTAHLYKDNGNQGDPTDFGDIRLVSRVSTGLLYGDAESPEVSDFSERAFLELQEQFSSTGNYAFIL